MSSKRVGSIFQSSRGRPTTAFSPTWRKICPSNSQTSWPSSVSTTFGAPVLERRGQAPVEHVRRLDQVVVDRDDRVADLPGLGVGQQAVGLALGHAGAPGAFPHRGRSYEMLTRASVGRPRPARYVPPVPLPRVRVPATDEFRAGFAAIRKRLEVPGPMPPEVEAAAAEAARRAVTADRVHRRDLPFVTIDPPGSRDLDQALCIEVTADGHRVHYAIADVAAFVDPGDPIDAEARRRVMTMYSPDERSPLHPTALSEGAASLLPDGDRPAVLWTVDLDDGGEVVDRRIERAVVRSRAQLDYDEGQRLADAGGHPALGELSTVGERRMAVQAARGGISLHLPSQTVVEQPGEQAAGSRSCTRRRGASSSGTSSSRC